MSASVLKESDESVYHVIELIRRRPGMWIGEPSISRLDSFLGGYSAGFARHGFTLRHAAHFHGFHDWTARHLAFRESTSGWANMIRARSSNEGEAFQKFFALLDEFRAESPLK
jgi:hypothetical protein